jgi:Fe-S-cluster containining protein
VSAHEPGRESIDAGPFAAWLDDMAAALRGEADADVPCGTCTACCTSSQFVHVAPDERATLARIPTELRFPAPGLPAGHVVLPYDADGHCPMLVAGACSIYEVRPRTCRTYDCRVFTAAAVEPDPETQSAIAARTRRWHFTVDTSCERDRVDAVARAATWLRAHARELPDGIAPVTPAQLAVLAVEVHDLFLAPPEPDPEGLAAAVDRLRR